MKSIWTLLLVAGVATGMAACNDKNAPATGGTGATGASNAADDDHGHDHADHDHDHDHGDAGHAHGDADTAGGTINAFLGAMGDGHFAEALEMCDPGTDGFTTLNELMTSSQSARDKGLNLDGMFSGPFDGAEAEAVTVDDARARYTVTLSTGRSLDVDLKHRDGKWWVIAPKELFQPRPFAEGEIEGMGATPPAGVTPPTGDTPPGGG